MRREAIAERAVQQRHLARNDLVRSDGVDAPLDGVEDERLVTPERAPIQRVAQAWRQPHALAHHRGARADRLARHDDARQREHLGVRGARDVANREGAIQHVYCDGPHVAAA